MTPNEWVTAWRNGGDFRGLVEAEIKHVLHRIPRSQAVSTYTLAELLLPHRAAVGEKAAARKAILDQLSPLADGPLFEWQYSLRMRRALRWGTSRPINVRYWFNPLAKSAERV